MLTASVHHVRIWDARNGNLMRVYRGLGSGNDELTTVCFDSEQQRKVFIGDHAGHALSYNYLNGAFMNNFAGHEDQPFHDTKAHGAEVSRIVYANQHNVVITASWDRSVNVYDDTEEGDGVLLRRMSGGHDADITALAFSSRRGVRRSETSAPPEGRPSLRSQTERAARETEPPGPRAEGRRAPACVL